MSTSAMMGTGISCQRDWMLLCWLKVHLTKSYIPAKGHLLKTLTNFKFENVLPNVCMKINTVQPKCNVKLAHPSWFACDWVISEKRGRALVSLANIQPYKCFSNSHEQNGCHAPILNNYSNRLRRASETLRLGCTVYLCIICWKWPISSTDFLCKTCFAEYIFA